MNNKSLATAAIQTLLAFVGAGAGLLAALLSQVSSPDYFAVLRCAASLAGLSSASGAVFALLVRGRLRWVPLAFSGLGWVGVGELALRLWR